jgi:predicted Zn finger-like uncharacterized protein
MIVQCEECKTNFNLDEKRLRGDSAKVRCSKCRHVFMIYKDQEESALTVAVDIFGDAASAPVLDSSDTFAGTEAIDSGFAVAPKIDQTVVDEPFAATFDGISFPNELEPTEATISDPAAPISDEFSFGDMSFSDEQAAETVVPQETGAKKSAFDEDMLSFADVALEDEESKPAPLATDSFDFDFSTNETAEPAAAKPSFDFDFGGSEETAHQPATAPDADLGGLDFGTPTAAPTTDAPAPFTFQAEEPSAPAFIPVPSAEDSGEESTWAVYRPFAIAGICATMFIGLLTGGYFYIKGAPGNLERMGIQNIGSEAEKEKGSFTITTPKAMFIKNKVSGELFVVSGNAINGYKAPRFGIEVQVTLFGKDGAELGVKTAYCGSTIDDEQLTTLPLAKIDEELTKEPSDDPLENYSVEAGKAAPCLVVFKDVPKQATEFGIEIITSKGEKLDDF